MFKHRETGKLVRLVNMTTEATYTDEEGDTNTIPAYQFNALYAEATAKEAATWKDKAKVDTKAPTK